MNVVFKNFEKSCSIYLDFLIEDFKFIKSEPIYVSQECSLKYKKGDFVLYVIYEYDDFPWIRVQLNSKSNSLDTIIKKNWPAYVIKRNKKITEEKEKIDSVLFQYSEFLKKYTLQLFEKKI